MNHGICRICGALLKPYDNACSVCGFEDSLDFDPRFSMDGDAFAQGGLEPDLDEEGPSDRD